MKVILHSWIFAVSIIMLMSGTPLTAATNPEGNKETVKPDKTVEVYFFHRNRRCGPCNTIENNTKKIINTQFKEQVEKGELSLKIINTDNPDNQQIAQKFNSRSTALFVVAKNGQEEVITNLTMMAMRLARDEVAFSEELSKCISEGFSE
jgi:thiol-disulfide isomerase/thioredoxin